MFCKNCRMQIEDNSDICPICGVKQFSEDDINERNLINKETLDNIKTIASDWVQTEAPDLGGDIYKEAIEPSLKKIKKAGITKIKKETKKIAKKITKIIGDIGKKKHLPF